MPVAINEAGLITGHSYTNGDTEEHAFLWKNGKMTDLGTPGGTQSRPVAINEAGQIIFYSFTLNYSYDQHAFLWEKGEITDLGMLGDTSSVPVAINEAGQVIGYFTTGDGAHHAFLASRSKMRN